MTLYLAHHSVMAGHPASAECTISYVTTTIGLPFPLTFTVQLNPAQTVSEWEQGSVINGNLSCFHHVVPHYLEPLIFWDRIYRLGPRTSFWSSIPKGVVSSHEQYQLLRSGRPRSIVTLSILALSPTASMTLWYLAMDSSLWANISAWHI